MKIYTKTGDKGTTSLIGGRKVNKDDIRIEGYGTVDELNSHIGLLRDTLYEFDIYPNLLVIQDKLLTIGSILASDNDVKLKLPELLEEDVLFLENEIDRMNKETPELRSFILPGGNVVVSNIHISRCVCRRAERMCVSINNSFELNIDLIVKYLNRLSDYLFVLSRYISTKLKVDEIIWKP